MDWNPWPGAPVRCPPSQIDAIATGAGNGVPPALELVAKRLRIRLGQVGRVGGGLLNLLALFAPIALHEFS